MVVAVMEADEAADIEQSANSDSAKLSVAGSPTETPNEPAVATSLSLTCVNRYNRLYEECLWPRIEILWRSVAERWTRRGKRRKRESGAVRKKNKRTATP